MANWLFKEEPTNYSYDALTRDGKTSWTGVKNPVAQRNLRSVKKGDRIFFYHTGNEKAVVGIAKAGGDAYPDPADKDGKLYAVDVVPMKKLPAPVDAGGDQGGPLLRDIRSHASPASLGHAGRRRPVGSHRQDGRVSLPARPEGRAYG